MTTATLAEIASVIRKHAPGALPKSIDSLGPLSIEIPDQSHLATRHDTITHFLPDDIAAAVLRDAMQMDCEAHRCGWSWFAENSRLEAKTFDDSDHGNSSLLSCYAAWKWARGIE